MLAQHRGQVRLGQCGQVKETDEGAQATRRRPQEHTQTHTHPSASASTSHNGHASINKGLGALLVADRSMSVSGVVVNDIKHIGDSFALLRHALGSLSTEVAMLTRVAANLLSCMSMSERLYSFFLGCLA